MRSGGGLFLKERAVTEATPVLSRIGVRTVCVCAANVDFWAVFTKAGHRRGKAAQNIPERHIFRLAGAAYPSHVSKPGCGILRPNARAGVSLMPAFSDMYGRMQLRHFMNRFGDSGSHSRRADGACAAGRHCHKEWWPPLPHLAVGPGEGGHCKYAPHAQILQAFFELEYAPAPFRIWQRGNESRNRPVRIWACPILLLPGSAPQVACSVAA